LFYKQRILAHFYVVLSIFFLKKEISAEIHPKNDLLQSLSRNF